MRVELAATGSSGHRACAARDRECACVWGTRLTSTEGEQQHHGDRDNQSTNSFQLQAIKNCAPPPAEKENSSDANSQTAKPPA